MIQTREASSARSITTVARLCSGVRRRVMLHDGQASDKKAMRKDVMSERGAEIEKFPDEEHDASRGDLEGAGENHEEKAKE